MQKRPLCCNGIPYSSGSTQAYYYQTNLQGDVTGIYDGTGTLLAVYDYDPFGKLLSVKNAAGTAITSSTHIANINPLRYRGYYYDTETGFYYLQTRYYDPAIGRFINADTFVTTDSDGQLSANMFAYCENNPISRCDKTGEFWHLVIGAAIGAVIGGVTAAISGGDLGDILISAAAGAASGALTASGVGLVGQVIGGAAISMTSNAATQVKNISLGKQESFSVGSMLLDGAEGALCGAISGPGASSVAAGAGGGKQMINLGIDTVKRTGSKFWNNGIKAAWNESKKAAKYYFKSTIKNTSNLFGRSNAISQIVNITYNLAT